MEIPSVVVMNLRGETNKTLKFLFNKMFDTLPFKQWVVLYGEDILSLVQKVMLTECFWIVQYVNLTVLSCRFSCEYKQHFFLLAVESIRGKNR